MAAIETAPGFAARARLTGSGDGEGISALDDLGLVWPIVIAGTSA